jgi:hypothetical protein
MKRFLVFLLLSAMTILAIEVPSPSHQTTLKTFNKDVLPVLQKNCQTCHRPGSVAPMSFTTYEGTRPWAKAIKAAVVSRKMPPWFADPHYGKFRNAPRITETEINTLAAWVDGGAREGAAADKPADLQWFEGWRIQPDVVVSMPEPHRLAPKGNGEIVEIFVENPFKEDTWVSAIEIRPGNPSVVHHVIVQIPELSEVQQQSALLRRTNTVSLGSYSNVLARRRARETGEGAFMTMEAVYAPGSPPLDFQYGDSAKLIQGGKLIRIEVHYTPNGTETTDQTKIAFTLAKAPPQRRFIMMAPEHLVDTRKPIPAGESDWETGGELTFKEDVELVWFMPHMHLRGKDMSYMLVSPNGHQETVLSAKYDFNWQTGYEVEKPIKVTKGTRLVVTAHHDNSANNPMNPTPRQAAQWGEMTAQEMMLPWFGVIVDRDLQPSALATYQPGELRSPKPVFTDGVILGRTNGE